jgi:hypothetical protein
MVIFLYCSFSPPRSLKCINHVHHTHYNGVLVRPDDSSLARIDKVRMDNMRVTASTMDRHCHTIDAKAITTNIPGPKDRRPRRPPWPRWSMTLHRRQVRSPSKRTSLRAPSPARRGDDRDRMPDITYRWSSGASHDGRRIAAHGPAPLRHSLRSARSSVLPGYLDGMYPASTRISGTRILWDRCRAILVIRPDRDNIKFFQIDVSTKHRRARERHTGRCGH